MFGSLCIVWTIRLSMLLYAAFLWLSVRGSNETSASTSRLRILWTAALMAYVCHVMAAFHFYHHWSHQHALEHTARRIDAMLGFSFGYGIYFSHLFLIIWLVDVGWWWLAPNAYQRRSNWIGRWVHWFLFFIAVNGTIVFESGAIRSASMLFLFLWAGRNSVELAVTINRYMEGHHRRMKVAYLTAGAAGMYCGSCLRDNTIAKAMRKQGVDVQLLPTYTPIRTDEEDASHAEVFFGGVNVFLQQKIPLFRYLPKWLDGILDRPGFIRWATKRSSSIDAKQLGGLTLSMLQGSRGFRQRSGTVVRLVCLSLSA
ncbi:MAG: hypothetical protein R3C28_12200 [Pirellulaceae bacterium]